MGPDFLNVLLQYGTMNEQIFNGPFWIAMAGLMISAIGVCSYNVLKSKCTECTICWGLIIVKRDVIAENDAEKMELERGVVQSPLNQQK
jgi:hypothetical protein